jgi:hypothetical protein
MALFVCFWHPEIQAIFPRLETIDRSLNVTVRSDHEERYLEDALRRLSF